MVYFSDNIQAGCWGSGTSHQWREMPTGSYRTSNCCSRIMHLAIGFSSFFLTNLVLKSARMESSSIIFDSTSVEISFINNVARKVH